VLERSADYILKILLVEWVITALKIICLIGMVAIIYFVIQRIRRGDEVKFFWFIQLSPNRVVEKQKIEFQNLNADSKQKTQIIKALNQIFQEVVNLLTSQSQVDYEQNKKALYDCILYSIGSILTKQKSDTHRVAIFIDNKDGYLRICEGFGFSSERKKQLRLKINDSAAGYTFRTGTPYYSGDVQISGTHFKVDSTSSESIKSLMCVLIKCGNIKLGVLSIDGQEINSFTKDDLDYLTYFADALTPLMYIEHINAYGEDGDTDVQNIEGESKERLA
jgi:transcriptional regulator with GAF, ATPase, and Fis domain